MAKKFSTIVELFCKISNHNESFADDSVPIAHKKK